jgi:hypothetical protein
VKGRKVDGRCELGRRYCDFEEIHLQLTENKGLYYHVYEFLVVSVELSSNIPDATAEY